MESDLLGLALCGLRRTGGRCRHVELRRTGGRCHHVGLRRTGGRCHHVGLCRTGGRCHTSSEYLNYTLFDSGFQYVFCIIYRNYAV